MVNYQEGKIYKIYSNIDDSICYIGSTTKKQLSQRMAKHRDDYKLYQMGEKNKYTSSIELFEKYGIETCYIELVENHPCNSKDELTKREGKYIRDLNCVNKRIEGRSKKEYKIENNEKIKIQNKIYRDKNHDKIKQYKIDNREILNKKNREYHENNKDIINEKRKLKIKCECGYEIRKSEISRHLKTIKHNKSLEIKSNDI